ELGEDQRQPVQRSDPTHDAVDAHERRLPDQVEDRLGVLHRRKYTEAPVADRRDATTLGAGGQPLLDHGLGGGATVGHPGQRRKERLALEAEHIDVVDRDYARRPWHVAQQRDLTEPVAGAEGLHETAVDLDAYRAVREQEVAIAAIALAQDD